MFWAIKDLWFEDNSASGRPRRFYIFYLLRCSLFDFLLDFNHYPVGTFIPPTFLDLIQKSVGLGRVHDYYFHF